MSDAECALKTCSTCQRAKPLSQFPRNGRKKNGVKYDGAAGYKSYCKPCYVDHMRGYYRRRPAKYERMKERARERKAVDPAGCLFRQVRSRATRAGTEFTITVEDLLPFPTVCPVLGIALEHDARGCHNPAAPSLDRIDNSRGYVPGNVLVVSFRANALKRDASFDELEKLASFYGRYRA